MLISIEGQFKDGQVTLTEAPAGVEQAKVIVTFLPPVARTSDPTKIRYGMFKGNRKTEPEDFREAEWHGTPGE